MKKFIALAILTLSLLRTGSATPPDSVNQVVNALRNQYYTDGCNRYVFYSKDPVSQEARKEVDQVLTEFTNRNSDATIFLWSEYRIGNDPEKDKEEQLNSTATLVCNQLAGILGLRKVFVLRIQHYDYVFLENGEGRVARNLWFIPATNDDEARKCVTETEMLSGLKQGLDDIYSQLVKNYIDQITNCSTGYTVANRTVKFLSSVSLAGAPNFPGNKPGKDDNIEDHAGLPPDERQAIENWVKNFGASAKIFITSEKTAWVDDLSVNNIDAIEKKFNSLDFNGKEIAVWLHYDEENQKVYIKHSFGKDVLRINPRYESIPNRVPTTIAELSAISDEKVNKALQSDAWMKVPQQKSPLGFIQSVVAVKNWTKQILGDLQLPQNMLNIELGAQYLASPVNIMPFIGGLGDGTFEELKSLPELVILGIDVAIDKPLRDKMISSVTSLTFEDVTKMAETMYREAADVYKQGGPKAGHMGGKHTVQIATIVLPITKAGKLKKGAELAEEGVDGMADLLRKISKELQDQVSGISDDVAKRQLIKELSDDTNLLKVFDDAALRGDNLVESWKLLDDAGRTGLKINARALEALNRIRKNPKLTDLRITDDMLSKIEGIPNVSYAEILDDLDQAVKALPQGKVVDFYKVISDGQRGLVNINNVWDRRHSWLTLRKIKENEAFLRNVDEIKFEVELEQIDGINHAIPDIVILKTDLNTRTQKRLIGEVKAGDNVITSNFNNQTIRYFQDIDDIRNLRFFRRDGVNLTRQQVIDSWKNGVTKDQKVRDLFTDYARRIIDIELNASFTQAQLENFLSKNDVWFDLIFNSSF